MSDWKEPTETRDAESTKVSNTNLSKEGIQSMQGPEPNTNTEADTADADPNSLSIEDGGKQAPLEDYIQPPFDPSKLKYETRSPHEDYQNYKDLTAAKRQHELGRQAATADSLPDAVETTLAARKEAKEIEETPMDEWFYKKHGRTPYTTAVYAKDEDQ